MKRDFTQAIERRADNKDWSSQIGNRVMRRKRRQTAVRGVAFSFLLFFTVITGQVYQTEQDAVLASVYAQDELTYNEVFESFQMDVNDEEYIVFSMNDLEI
jgi:hypothetical protein